MEWRTLRYHLHHALELLHVSEIYLLDKENNVVTVCIVLEDGGLLPSLRKLTQLRMVDRLIAVRAPELYRQFLFCYEVWERKDWHRQRVIDVINRRTGRVALEFSGPSVPAADSSSQYGGGLLLASPCPGAGPLDGT